MTWREAIMPAAFPRPAAVAGCVQADLFYRDAPMKTVTAAGEPVELLTGRRHHPCVGIRGAANGTRAR
ncbi:hypothetical protein DF286_07900 [Sphingosinicella humi]|uniref:Uncharacterized protein n=1 Tax=Allosphingosinicella humi TaxID=2068657 RepID=A0A2U2J3B3_9SPHN|nr:hypothetical protein DF286_07900 [Sphingosinicella humi]